MARKYDYRPICLRGNVPYLLYELLRFSTIDYDDDIRLPAFVSWLCQFLVFDVMNMEIVFEGRDSRSWIRACCYSPDGKIFALASTDNKIYLYDSKSFALKAKVRIMSVLNELMVSQSKVKSYLLPFVKITLP